MRERESGREGYGERDSEIEGEAVIEGEKER